MNRLSFVLALLGMLGLSVFIYFCYPNEWRRNRVFRVVVILFHVLGVLGLAMVFTCYKNLPEPWKWTVSRWGTIYYVVTMFMSIFCAARLAVVFLVRRFGPKDGKRADGFIKTLQDGRVQSALFLVVSFTVAVIGFIRIGEIRSTEYDITFAKPAAVRNLKVRLCADIHAGAGTWRVTYDDLRERLQEGDPDLILIAGDVFDETTSQTDVEYVRTVMESLHPRYGIYYVYGNHDDFREDWAAEQMRSMHVKVLEDEMIEIEGVQIIGRLDPKDNPMDLDQLWSFCAADETKPVIVLQHRPIEFRKLAEKKADLVLAGHTHGFNIPQFMAVGMQSDMFYGRKQYGIMTAAVTSGVSAWGFHYKFPAFSEVVTLNLSFLPE